MPNHWELRRLKFAALLVNEKIDAKQSDLEYTGLEHIESWTGKHLINEEVESEGIGSKFIKNDVLFGKLRPF
jgi:type I restriction enzyme S subunit